MRLNRVVVGVLLVSFLLTVVPGCGCGSDGKAKVANPFTTDYPITAENIGFFVNGDTVETIAAANPFYSGVYPLPGQKLEEFEALREKKVTEILKEADQLVKKVEDADKELGLMRNDLFTLLDKVRQNQTALSDFERDTLVNLVSLSAERAILITEYKTITVDENAITPVKSFSRYVKVGKAMEAARSLLEETDEILKRGAVAYYVLSDQSDQTMKQAAAEFDQAMSKKDDLRKKVQEVVNSVERIDIQMRQVITADNFLAKAALAYMQNEMPTVKKAAQELKPNASISATQIDAVKSYVSFYEAWINELAKEVNNVDKRLLLEMAGRDEDSYAWAADTEEITVAYSNALKILEVNPEEAVKKQERAKEEKGFFATGWEYTKKVTSKAVLEARNAVGFGIDAMGATFRNVTATGFGVYHGLGVKDIASIWQQNYQEVGENWKKGIAGAETLKTAVEYVEGVEQAAGEVAGAGVETLFGKGRTSSAVNFLAKTTAGMFTDLAKGIYKIANAESSVGKTAEGVLDIALSMVGGSKSIVKASQVGKIAAEEGALAGKAGASFIAESYFNQNVKKVMKENAELLAKQNLTWEQVVKLESNKMIMEINEKLAKDMADWRKGLLEKVGGVLKAGGKEALEHAKTAAGESLEEMFKKSFANSISGYKEALKSVVGGSATEYIDNVFANVLDSYTKELAAEAIDALFLPSVEELNGRWTGTTKVTEVNANTGNPVADDVVRKTAFQMGEQPFVMDVTLNEDGTGTAVAMSPDGANARTYAFQYQSEDGKVSLSTSSNDLTYVFEGKLSVEGDFLVIKGQYVQKSYHPSWGPGGFVEFKGVEVMRKQLK